MKIIGVFGGSGSGKSTLSKQLADLGAYVIDADLIARQIMTPHVVQQIGSALGGDFSLQDGSLNRPALARTVFSDAEKLLILNRITHPLITQTIQNQLAEAEQNYSVAVVDAAALLETDLYKLCNVLVAVCAPKELRIQRIMARDGLNYTDAARRIEAQKPDKDYTSQADYVFYNDNTADGTAFARRLIEAL